MLSIKICFVEKERNAKKKKKKNVDKNLSCLILKQYQSADLKSFWNWFGVSDLCKDFVECCFLCGHFYKEL